MEEKTIQPEESLAIIQEMVQKTKQHYGDNSFYFILWGWLTFVAAMAHYLLLPVYSEKSAIVWLLMPLGAIISLLYSRRQTNTQLVKTHLETYIGSLWMALGMAMVVLCISTVILQTGALLPSFILLYAVGTFATGRFIQFKPLMIGGALCFIISAFSYFSEPREQLLFVALAVLLSYLIPGYALKYRSIQRVNERA